jgi:hypothetical protein
MRQPCRVQRSPGLEESRREGDPTGAHEATRPMVNIGNSSSSTVLRCCPKQLAINGENIR